MLRVVRPKSRYTKEKITNQSEFMWKTESVGGKAYRVLQQDQAQSCGLCCIGMVLNLIDKREVSEVSLAARSRDLDPETADRPAAYQRATKDRVGFVKMVTAKADPGLGVMGERRILSGHAAPDYGKRESLGKGTAASHLLKVLADYRVGAQKAVSVKEAMRAVSPGRPSLVLVQITGGHHWVLVVNRETRYGRASIYTILDPFGLATTNTGSDTYTAGGRPGRGGRFMEGITTSGFISSGVASGKS
jgi:hypothetical protein